MPLNSSLLRKSLPNPFQQQPTANWNQQLQATHKQALAMQPKPASRPVLPGEQSVPVASLKPTVRPPSPATTSPRPAMAVPAPKPPVTPIEPFGGVPDASDPAMVGGRAMLDQRGQDARLQALADKDPEAADAEMDRLGYTGSPNSPERSGKRNAQLAALRQSYLGTFSPTEEETTAQQQLGSVAANIAADEAAARSAYAQRVGAINEQATLQPFLTGRQRMASGELADQLAALKSGSEAQTLPLASRLAQLQADRESRRLRGAAEVGFAQSDIERQQAEADKAAAAKKPIEVGGVLVDPVTFQPVYKPDAKPIELSEGTTLVDPSGKPLYTAPKTYKATGGTTGSDASGGGVGAGGTASPLVSNWAQNILNGRANLSNVPAAIRNAVSAEVARQTENLQKLSPAQAGEIADIDTLNSLVSEVQTYGTDGTIEGVGPLAGSVGAFGSKYLGTGSEEAKNVRALVGNIRGTIAKVKAGTSFTANEEKLLDTYTPKSTDSQELLISKLVGLKNFLQTRKNAIVSSASTVTRGAQTAPSAGNADPLGIR